MAHFEIIDKKNFVCCDFRVVYKKPPAADISILLQEAFLFNVRFYGFSSACLLFSFYIFIENLLIFWMRSDIIKI